ncbi:MAG: type IV pilus secretin PilQ [Desulfobacterium sp.]|nr:type IV pilus secretin PilQ [Desulfobacterium sp.]
MGNKMFRHSTILAALVALVMISGCSALGEKEPKPDGFEKWRIMAEDSKGYTPDPRKYDIALEEDAREREKVEAQQRLKKEKELQAVKPLPDMPVTMKMHDVSVSVLLRTLARAAEVNIMINESVTGQAKINISNIPWNQAFEGLLSTYGLTFEWTGDILRVITVEDLNKDIALMEAKQKFEKSKKTHSIAMLEIAQEEAKLDPLVTRIVKIDYADLAPLRANLEAFLVASKKDIKKKKGAKKGDAKNASAELRGTILMDASTNSLVLQATQKDIKKIMPIIQRLDRPTDQILIEAHIVEANSDTAKELGIQWGGLGLNTTGDYNNWLGGPLGKIDSSLVQSSDDATDKAPAGTPITHLPGIGNIMNFPSSEKAGTEGWAGMALGLVHENVGKNILYAQLTALQEEGKLNILSKPSISTMDHRKATIESGKLVPFQTIEDGDIKIEWKDAVISLEVTPHVVNQDVVRLEIVTHKDELDWTHTVAGNPTIVTKNAETKVALYDGQTTVIGGLNKEKVLEGEAGVPWLKDIPGLGKLFRSNSKSQDMEELLIFITPHILKEKGAQLKKVND